MSSLKVFFALMLTFSGLAYAANPRPLLEENHLSCEKLIKGHPYHPHALAKKLYQQAFIASFDGDVKKAEAASQCASLIENGSRSWPIEARTMINR